MNNDLTAPLTVTSALSPLLGASNPNQALLITGISLAILGAIMLVLAELVPGKKRVGRILGIGALAAGLILQIVEFISAS